MFPLCIAWVAFDSCLYKQLCRSALIARAEIHNVLSVQTWASAAFAVTPAQFLAAFSSSLTTWPSKISPLVTSSPMFFAAAEAVVFAQFSASSNQLIFVDVAQTIVASFPM